MSSSPAEAGYSNDASLICRSSSCLSGETVFSEVRLSTSSPALKEGEYMRPKMKEDSEDETNSDYSDGSDHLSIDYETLDDVDDCDTVEVIPPLSSSPPDFRSSSPCASIGESPADASCCFSMSGVPESQISKSSQLRSGEALSNMSSLLSVALREHSELRSRLVPDTPVAETHCWDGLLRRQQNSRGSLTPRGYPSSRLPTIKDEDEDTDPLDLVTNMEYGTISPMSFASNQALEDSSLNIDSAPNTRYRVIKRASSYLSFQSQEESPDIKRQKVAHDSGVSRIQPYARQTATLRRAESLKSGVDIDSPSSQTDTPIIPSTPLAEKPSKTKVIDGQKPLPNPVPIIAPPIDYMPGLPLSEENCSKLRVNRFLERDSRRRELDGFPQLFTLAADRTVHEAGHVSSLGKSVRDERAVWEDRLGIGSVRRLNAINWILDVTPAVPDPDTPSSTNPSLSSSQNTLSSSTEDDLTLHEKSQGIDDLLDQLSTSRETRFHACWLFLRYFYAIMSPSSTTPNSLAESLLSRTSSLDSQSSGDTERQGRDLMIWDIAVACLSLSVKFHRDFLGPLLPVYAHEYLYLSPHAMARDDLESAHRDVLAALEYSLGVSPQPLVDEFWFALPSLRALLDFQGGWSHALEDAWMFLFDAVCEPDVQRFSIPLLTTVAILDGIIESLVHRYRVEDTGSPSFSPSGSETEGSHRNSRRSSRRSREMLEQRAREEAEGVLLDVQALVGIKDV